jgi:hypothetical protein
MIFSAGNTVHLHSFLQSVDTDPSRQCRSTGYGSLEVWIRHLRQGITFQLTYKASDECSQSSWEGSAFTVAGGYVWKDVYSEATKRNVVVVGGGDPVCSTL